MKYGLTDRTRSSSLYFNSVNSDGTLKSTTVTSIAQRASPDAVEASAIFQYNGYYYLFTSWDTCCQGTSSTYNIRVGRSTSVAGTYVDKSGVSLLSGGGTLVLGTHDSVSPSLVLATHLLIIQVIL